METVSDTFLGFGPRWLVRTDLDQPGDVVTFYSYKGGTGRSMGLVNCAGLIASHIPEGTKPILMIDFDLEAPGLHRYLLPYLGREDLQPRSGVLELFDALSARIVVKHKAEEKALSPSRLDLELKFLRKERERYLESELHMPSIARGMELPLYDRNILKLEQSQEILSELECEKQSRDEKAEQDKIYRKAFVRLSELAVWLRQERDIDVTLSMQTTSWSARQLLSST